MRLVILNNIPTPYRDHFFAKLNSVCLERHIEFCVWYMALSEPGRSWSRLDFRLEYPATFLRGPSITVGSLAFHFNPSVFARILAGKPSVVVLGGGWNLPSTILALLACRLRRDVVAVIWLEANRWFSTFRGRFANALRRLVVRMADAYAVPGQEARETIESVWRAPARPFILLPNSVEAALFSSRVTALRSQRLGLREKWAPNYQGRVLLIPARLIENLKGIVNFLKAIGPAERGQVTLLIAGEGEDRPLVECWLRQNRSVDARLLGFVPEPGMLELYALADGVALPSFREASPLVLIEGLAAGLPLLASCLCGNTREAVAHRENGWVFDPREQETIGQAVSEFTSVEDSVLERMGRASWRRAGMWENSRVAEYLVGEVLDLWEQKLGARHSRAPRDRSGKGTPRATR
jgi:glycosyltransferase involved in cell wall biosynthesis